MSARPPSHARPSSPKRRRHRSKIARRQHRILPFASTRLRPGEVYGVGFAGIGGACKGFERAFGVPPFFACNHDPYALSIHRANHPETKHFEEDMFRFAVRDVVGRVVTRGRINGRAHFTVVNEGVRVGWAHLSPDCRDHSRAKGGKPVSKEIRGLAWAVKKWAVQISPRIISVENVPEFVGWGPLVAKRDKATGRCLINVEVYDIKSRKLNRKLSRVEVAAPGVVVPYGLQILVRDRRREGQYFRQLVHELRMLGYVVEWKDLRACDFGAATSRKRLFILARRDGEPIAWPDATHATPSDARVKSGQLLPFRTAAECIDFVNPDGTPNLGKSIFDRKKMHAEATCRRVAQGVYRFVLQRRPFIVNLTHGGRLESVDAPASTITSAHRGEKAIAMPVLMSNNSNNAPHAPDDALGTITTGNRHFAVSPLLAKTHSNGSDGEASGVTPCDEPTRTLLAKDGLCVITPHITKFNTGSVGRAADEPIYTITSGHGSERPAGAAHGLGVVSAQLTPAPDVAIAPALIQTSYGERDGQSPRALDLEKPLGTVVAGGQKHAVVGAFLAKHHGSGDRWNAAIGQDLYEPIHTIIGKDNKSVVAASLVQQNYGSSQWQTPEQPLNTVTQTNHHAVVSAGLAKLRGTSTTADTQEPAPTISAQGQHLGLVTAHIAEYYGSDQHGAAIDSPLPTVTTKDRFALVVEFLERYIPGLHFPDRVAKVEIDGVVYVIADIFMRMLTPRELARCQGFDDDYILFGTVTQQVGGVGNSVPPHFTMAIAAANLDGGEPEELAA